MAETIEGASSEVADRYAQAGFELAQESGAIDALDQDFRRLEAALAESADLRAAIASPLIDADDKSRALVAVAEKLGLTTLSANLIGVVAKNGRAAELPGVAAVIRRLVARHRGMSQVEIVSAHPLEPHQLEKLVSALAQSLGRKVDPVLRVDENLIGGFIVRAGSRQFDASIKTKLDSLKLALKSA